MITPMQMYWLLKLDDISGFCTVALFVSLFLLWLSMTAYWIGDEDTNEKDKKTVRILFCLAVISGIFFGCVKTFLPSTNQMAAIYVVPAIVNNERVKNIGNKTLDISEDLLKLTEQYLQATSINKSK